MQEMTTINDTAKVSKEYGPLSTSPKGDEVETSMSSRKKKILKRSGAINLDEDESVEESGSIRASAGTNFKK